MKKIYSIVNGNIAFFIVMSPGILCFIIGCILIPNPDCAGPFEFMGFIIVLLLIMYKLKYLNYVRIGEAGIEYKKRLYTWEEIKFTVSYSSYGIANYVYRFYFDNKYLVTQDEIKNCRKKGQFIDVNRFNKLDLVLQYYNEKVYVYAKCPYGKKLMQKIEEHNNMINDG